MRPIEEVVREVVAARKDPLPTVVWFCHPDDGQLNQKLEEEVLEDEKVAIALQRFVCLQGNVANVPAGKLADDLRRSAPVFLLYDPTGKPLGRIEGKKAASCRDFYEVVEEAWSATHKTKLRDFTRKMASNLDRVEKVDDKLDLLEAKRARAGGSASRVRAIDREKEKLEQEKAKLLEERKEIVAECRLRDDLVPEGEDSAQK